MSLDLYGIRNCDTMKKARTWLEANAVAYSFHDYKAEGADAALLAAWCAALGWELNAERFMGTHGGPHTFGKTGFTGASIVADADRRAGVVLLSNFTWPMREKNADRIHAFRARLSDLFFENLD